MKSWVLRVIACGFPLGISVNAQAVSGGYAAYYIIYNPPLTHYNCLMKQQALVPYDKLLSHLAKGVFAETKTYSPTSGSDDDYYFNANALADGTAKIKPIFNFYRYTESIREYSFTLDFEAVSSENGSSQEGRQKTIDHAKLSVIALLKTAELNYSKGKYRIWIKLDNLPSSQGVTGSKIHAGSVDWPKLPYTAASPVYQTYLKEMDSEFCGKNRLINS